MAAVDVMNEPEAQFLRGNELMGQGRAAEAIEAYRASLKAQANHPVTLFNLGNAFKEAGRGEEAVEAYEAALAANPNFADAAYNLAQLLRELRRPDEALAAYGRVLAIQPDYRDAFNDMGEIHRDLAQYDQAMACYARELELHPGHVLAENNRLFTLNYHPDYSPQRILREHLDWNRRHIFRAAPHASSREPERRLKVGYVSPDFRRHCQSFFTIPLLSHHDHARFEIYCYADVSRPDEITRRIQGHADTWRSTVGKNDEQIAQLIRDDGIDILVDLTMHMAHGRPGVFARKPAPIQIAWLAYPGTTGLSAMDYRFSDPYLDPPGEHDGWYAEMTIRLPDTFWCYDPLSDVPAVQDLPASKNGFVTFGCLNNFCKVTDQTLDLWAKVLEKVPDSHLILLSPKGEHRQRVISRLGVARSRIEFVEFLPRAAYLETYRRIDLCLDTFPINGHTTSLDALWMGVPVVSMTGQAAIARAGISQSTNLGLVGELTGAGPDEFVILAVGLARNLPKLQELRRGLRQRMEGSVLMDGARFTRSFESIFRDIWREYCR
jgi:protein O-GlcNAc transferase